MDYEREIFYDLANAVWFPTLRSLVIVDNDRLGLDVDNATVWVKGKTRQVQFTGIYGFSKSLQSDALEKFFDVTGYSSHGSDFNFRTWFFYSPSEECFLTVVSGNQTKFTPDVNYFKKRRNRLERIKR